MLTTTPTRTPSLSVLLLAAASIATVSLLAPRVFADDSALPPPLRGLQSHRLGSEHDPMAAYQGEIDECYQLARAKDENLIVHTLAEFEVDPKTYVVSSARVPTPASPVFQSCVEQRALGWSFPPPADMPPPPADLPKHVKLLVAVYIDRQP